MMGMRKKDMKSYKDVSYNLKLLAFHTIIRGFQFNFSAP